MRVYKNDGTKNTRLTLTADDSGAKIHYRDADNAGALRFNNNLGEVMRIPANTTRVGIGTSSPRSTINASSASGAILTLESSDTTLGENEVVGQIDFYANDASTNSTGNKAFIKAYSETAGGNKVALDFATSTSTSATGVVAMTINSDGDVGIGTSSVTSVLDVVGPAARPASLVEVDTASTARFRADSTNNDSLYIAEASSGMLVQCNDGATNSTTAKPLSLQPFGGNVGIGTSPSSALHVSDAVTHAASTEVALIQNTTTGQPVALALQAVADNGGTGNEGAIYFDAGADGTAANNQLQFTADHQSDTTPDMIITGAGNVGIGTSSPSYKLAIRDDSTSAYPLSLENNNIGTSGVHVGMRFGYAGNTFQKGAIIYESTDASGYGRGRLLFALEGTANTSNADETDAKMAIDYSGNVGIGTTSPSSLQAGAENLVVGSGSGDEGITIYSGNANRGNIYFADGTTGSDPYRGQINYFHDSDYLRFVTAASERMRIDSSGNLLVGKTTTGVANVGIEARNSGLIGATRDGAAPAYFNRLTDDGDIATFNKDSSVICAIGSINGSMYIQGKAATGKSGLTFYGSYIEPRDNGAGADAAIDLGISSARFRDLYLSGDVYATNIKGQNDVNTKIEFLGSDVTSFCSGR